MNTPLTYPKKHFRGQTEEEVVITFFRKHWIVLLKYFFYLGILLLLILSSFFLLPSSTSLLGPIEKNYTVRILYTCSFLIALISGSYIFTCLINYYLDIVIITNLRVVEVQKTIFFKNKVHTVGIETIQEIKAEKEGFIGNSFGFGTIYLSSNNSSYEKQLSPVPTPHYFADIISNLKHTKS